MEKTSVLESLMTTAPRCFEKAHYLLSWLAVIKNWYKMLLYSFTMSNAIMMLIASSGLYTCFKDYCYLPWINYTDKVLTKLILMRQLIIWAFILWAISTANTVSSMSVQILYTHSQMTVLRFKMFLRRSFSGLYSSLNIQAYRLSERHHFWVKVFLSSFFMIRMAGFYELNSVNVRDWKHKRMWRSLVFLCLKFVEVWSFGFIYQKK